MEQAALKIRPTRRRRLKNAVSRRTLPLHPELIRLGFLDYVRDRSGARSDLIFAEIAQFGENTPLSNLFDKRWTVVLDEAVPSAREERKTFHSFRHFGNTEMIRQQVLDPIRESMMGHEGATVNSRNYKKTLKPEDLRTAIAAIPEVTRDLRAYDWTLIVPSLTLGSLGDQVSAKGRSSRRRSLPSSPLHALRKDNREEPGRSSLLPEACPRRNQKPFDVP